MARSDTQGRDRFDIGQNFRIEYAQLYFVRHTLNTDSIASATAVCGLLPEIRRYRTDTVYTYEQILQSQYHVGHEKVES